jgi:hypothetical protein
MKSQLRKKLIEYKNTVRKQSRLLTESTLNGKTIINVDIQPEYQSYISFNINKWVNFLNESEENNNIVFLYNGQDTLGMVSESEYIDWLFDLGIDEEVINNATFYDKGYAFFRFCMDNSIDEDAIVDLVKYMMTNDITDSRDIDEDMWNDFMNSTNHSRQDVRDLLENADDLINIPELMEFLQNKNNIALTGGGVNECLKEVEIALLALDKPYSIISEFTY